MFRLFGNYKKYIIVHRNLFSGSEVEKGRRRRNIDMFLSLQNNSFPTICFEFYRRIFWLSIRMKKNFTSAGWIDSLFYRSDSSRFQFTADSIFFFYEY